MREESHFRIPDPVRNSFSFQKIDKRDGALIISVQNSCLLRAAVGHLKEILVLRPASFKVDFSDARPLRALRLIETEFTRICAV